MPEQDDEETGGFRQLRFAAASCIADPAGPVLFFFS